MCQGRGLGCQMGFLHDLSLPSVSLCTCTTQGVLCSFSPPPSGPALLLVTWCLLPGACSLVLIAWCLLLGACYLVLISWCLLPGAHSLVLIAWCLLPGACYLMLVTWCLLPGAYSLVLVTWCLLLGACCLVLITWCLPAWWWVWRGGSGFSAVLFQPSLGQALVSVWGVGLSQ